MHVYAHSSMHGHTCIPQGTLSALIVHLMTLTAKFLRSHALLRPRCRRVATVFAVTTLVVTVTFTFPLSARGSLDVLSDLFDDAPLGSLR